MFFKVPMQVNYFDCDQNNRMKLSAVMRYMQETSSEHLEAIHVPTQKLADEHMVFLLTKSCMKIERMPQCREPILIGTAAVAIRGVRFVREFVVDTPKGERLVSAMTLWVLVDPASRRIIRPKSFPYPLPLQPSTLEDIIDDLPIPKALTTGEAHSDVQIRYSHLDVNAHVNNACYGDFVCDALPFEELITQGLDTVAILFQHEARRGETLQISTSALGERRYYVGGLHPDASVCFEAYASLK